MNETAGCGLSAGVEGRGSRRHHGGQHHSVAGAVLTVDSAAELWEGRGVRRETYKVTVHK